MKKEIEILGVFSSKEVTSLLNLSKMTKEEDKNFNGRQLYY